MTRAGLERIVERMRVPVVTPALVVMHGWVDPDHPHFGAISTYVRELRTLYVRPDIDPYGLRHEYGHVFDAHALRDEHRELLLRWWKIPGRFWDWDDEHDPLTWEGPEAGCEIFANVYARAATSRSPRWHRFKRLCRAAYREAA